MRRKVVQDFANTCCQMLLTSLSNMDAVNFVIFGSGIVKLDFLSSSCSYNGVAISPLHYHYTFRTWLKEQCRKNKIRFSDITHASLDITVKVSTRRKASKHKWLSVRFGVNCKSCIASAEKNYTAEMSDEIKRGLGQVLYDHVY